LKKKLTEKDKKDWLNFVNSKNKILDKDSNNNRQKIVKEKIIDLHGYSLENANKIIENFILISFKDGVSKIVVITGKGSRSKNINNPYQSKDLAILKYSVPNYIQSKDNLMKMIKKINLDHIEDRSFGSFEIFLKNKFW